MSRLLILFTRYPTPGQAKTRLIPALGPEGAAAFHRRMTEFTLRQAREASDPLQVRFTGGTEEQLRSWLGDDLTCLDQGEGDLGNRIEKAFADGFRAGASQIVLIGSDCPNNRSPNIRQAFRLLEKHPCVIGPAADGGYYLIGLTRPHPTLFSDIPWGTGRVLHDTLARVRDYALLPTLGDIDKASDIPPRISVIIPARNEEAAIASCIRSVQSGFHIETVVVDGGSTDSTRRIAAQNGAAVIESRPGRACQMNAGAALADGDILLFLHADSLLPPEWDRLVRNTLALPHTAMGFFRFAIRENFRSKPLIEWGTRLRSRILQLPYGDQGLCCTRNTFFRLGGYPDVPILEDVYLVRRARKIGRLREIPAPLHTSGRRWLQYGVLRTTLLNQAVLLAAARGTDLHRLREAYRENQNPFRVTISRW
jgi:rSAM/selenodomain-associated transferase 2/rSAM/selenodomain-associated transferase 1